MASVLVTHADRPLGRAIARRLEREQRHRRVLRLRTRRATDGTASTPNRANASRETLRTADLTNEGSAAALFAHGLPADLDTLVYVLADEWRDVGDPRRVPGGIAPRLAQARILLRRVSAHASIERLVVVGSAFVYHVAPGVSTLLDETSPLEWNPEAGAESRSWVDCDLLFQRACAESRPQVVLLRVPAVVAPRGVRLHPSHRRLAAPLRAPGFDPVFSTVTPAEVADVVARAVRTGPAGVYNVSGGRSLPLSRLEALAGVARPGLRPLLHRASALLAPTDPLSPSRFGFRLDDSRLRRELGPCPVQRDATALRVKNAGPQPREGPRSA